MSDRLKLAEIEQEIREVRANLRELVEQETARSGAQDEKLARLMEQREALSA